MPILGTVASFGLSPEAPTIGTATAGDTSASVAFTPSTYIGKGIITYTATSSPDGLTATDTSSPLTVTGLTNGTAYTFTVVGTTNYGVASVASASSNSVTPAAVSAFQSIATFTPTGSSNTVTFSAIPQTFKHLQLRINSLSTTNTSDFAYLRPNGDTSTDYYTHIMQSSSTISGVSYAGSTYSAVLLGVYAGMGGQAANVPTVAIIDILNYTSTTNNKTIRSLIGTVKNGSGVIEEGSGVWYSSPTAITSITIVTNFNYPASTGSWALYGIKGV